MKIKTNKKIKVAILFGGKSAEHEISIRSAKNIIDAIDKNKYEVTLLKINKDGKFPWSSFVKKNLDVIFPILHGPFGEDGTIQGLLKLANIPFVGAGVLGSAVGMDKDVMKRLLRDAGIPVGKFLVFTTDKVKPSGFNKVVQSLEIPFFVKPANLGSSVGVSKVKNKKEFVEAVEEAFKYDTKIIIEENIEGREIECAVLGNDNPTASVPGEIIPSHEFYSYEAKYLDENGASLEIPAKVSKEIIKKIQTLAIKTFKTLACEGMGRVDFFLKKDGTILVNEINTIPGFTSVSMYPKMWEASGISYAKLIDSLIQLALERFAKEQKLKTSR
jgi:D-alanine-D-alanine ligase